MKIIILTALLSLSFNLFAQRPKLEPLNFPFKSLGINKYKLVKVFTALKFETPTMLNSLPGEMDSFVVVERDGRIYSFKTGSTDKKLFLDIKDKVKTDIEEGLLGFAFDPKFQTNGLYYVFYSIHTKLQQNGAFKRQTVVSQFKAKKKLNIYETDLSTEKILLIFDRPQANHIGGMLAFYKDDLYIGVGDGGGAWGNQGNNSQNTKNFMGSILRITPNDKGGYTIPNDNPFAKSSTSKKEIYAFGVRNPWRFSFDRLTGKLWLGDVGQDDYEEINLVENGDNLGWNLYEGFEKCKLCKQAHDFVFKGVHKKPFFTLIHPIGGSITGGYVYRGAKHADLYGKYIYADYLENDVWALSFNDSKPISNDRLAKESTIISLAEDEFGELYFLSYTGEIYQLEKEADTTSGSIPKELSKTGLFTNLSTLKPQSGLIAYDVNSPLWSDGASKKRFIALPDQAFIDFKSNDHWDFPENTVLVKHFEIEVVENVFRKLETRVLIYANKAWTGFTYIWNEDQSEAFLNQNGKSENLNVWDKESASLKQLTWEYPSQNQCLTCHTKVSGYALGVNAIQLNQGNQLKKLEGFEYFNKSLGDTTHFNSLANPEDESLELSKRARSYLHVQCSHCHSPGGPTPSSMDLRFESVTSELYKAPGISNLGISGARLIAPGEPEKSIIFHRLLSFNPSVEMPPLGTKRKNVQAENLLRLWIESL